VAYRLMSGLTMADHQPEVDDFGPCTEFRGDGAEKFADGDAVAGFPLHFAQRGLECAFLRPLLAPRQYPAVILPPFDHCNQRRAASCYDNAARGHDRCID